MKHTILIAILFLGFTSSCFAQKKRKTFKQGFALEANIGYPFPSYNIKNQEQLSAKTHFASSPQISFLNRIHPKWRFDIGIGFTHYRMEHVFSDSTEVIMTFTTPKIFSSINYTFYKSPNHIFFTQLGGGFHRSYRNKELSKSAYSVQFTSEKRFHFFVRPEIGYRKYFKHKIKGAKFKNPYEIGLFYQINTALMGEAHVFKEDFDIIVNTDGSMVGMYYRIVIPSGKQKMTYYETDKKSKKEEPTIMNPRF